MDKITITLTPRQALALRTGLEQLASLLRDTGYDQPGAGFRPFYKAAQVYTNILKLMPSRSALTGETIVPAQP